MPGTLACFSRRFHVCAVWLTLLCWVGCFACNSDKPVSTEPVRAPRPPLSEPEPNAPPPRPTPEPDSEPSAEPAPEPQPEPQPEPVVQPEPVPEEPEPEPQPVVQPVLEPVPEPDLDPTEIDGGVLVDFDAAAVPEDLENHPMGVASGAMAYDRALLWTFVRDAATRILRVWREEEQSTQVYLVAERLASPLDSGYVHEFVQELAPGTQYQFAFFDRDNEDNFIARSEIGQFRTAWALDSMQPLTIGASACTNSRFAPYPSIGMTAREEVDFFVHLGDMSYNDAAETLPEYRDIWRSTLTEENYRELLRSTGTYFTWDDHEIDNDWNPERIDPVRLAAAKQAFFETLPVERGENDRLWTSYRWGLTAEIFILDSRGERRPSTREGDRPIYISPAQMDWLTDGLSNSPCHFKIVLNSVPITNMPPVWIRESDRWEGYGAQRRELLRHITENNISNVWFLAGDFHSGFVSHLESEGPAFRLREIAVGPGASGSNPLLSFVDSGVLTREEVYPRRQFDYGAGNTQVVTTLTFRPLEDVVRVVFRDAQTSEVLLDRIIGQGEIE